MAYQLLVETLDESKPLSPYIDIITMGAQFTLKVLLPTSEPAVGAEVTGYNRNAADQAAVQWHGSTLDDGTCTWVNIDTGLLGDKYDFYCRYLDSNSVEWTGSLSERIKGSPVPVIRTVMLRQLFMDEWTEFSVTKGAEESLSKLSEGKEILDSMKEMSMAIRNHMSHSAMALSTYILEGIIKAMARKKGVKEAGRLDNMTFGELINDKEVSQIITAGELDKLRGLNKFRVSSVHFKGVSTVIEEARIGARLIMSLINELTS